MSEPNRNLPMGQCEVGGTYGLSFRVKAKIGEGGMGAVYLVEHLSWKVDLALKVLHPEFRERPDIVRRFEAEGRALFELDHPNIVRVFAAATDPVIGPFFVMELLEGMTLAGLLRLFGALPPVEVLRIMIAVADTVETMHRAGMIHRDLKPDNIFLSRHGDPNSRVRVIDLGIAKIEKYNEATTERHINIGSSRYMSPEHILGVGVSPRSDIYALGHIGYEALSGAHAFGRNHQGVATNADFQIWHVHAEIEPLIDHVPELAKEVWTVLAHAMERKPEDRFASMGDFANALRAALNKQAGGTGTKAMRALPLGGNGAPMSLEEALALPQSVGVWGPTRESEPPTEHDPSRPSTERAPSPSEDAPMLPVAYLEVSDARGPRRIPLTERTYTIGRYPDRGVDLVIDESSLSGRHARLVVDRDHATIEDLDSTNGVRVNKKRSRFSELRHGDALRFGRLESRFLRVDLDAVDEHPAPQIIEVRSADEASVTETAESPTIRRPASMPAATVQMMVPRSESVVDTVSDSSPVVTPRIDSQQSSFPRAADHAVLPRDVSRYPNNPPWGSAPHPQGLLFHGASTPPHPMPMGVASAGASTSHGSHTKLRLVILGISASCVLVLAAVWAFLLR